VSWCQRRWCVALLLLIVPAAAHASPSRLGGGGDLSISIWRIAIAFIICAAAAFITILFIRRRAGGGSVRLSWNGLPLRNRRIEVIETRRLSTHADISLVRENGREYLLLLFAGGSQILREQVADLDEEVGQP
jgi:hypothetical protein